MTLHEAIEEILVEVGQPLSTKKIAALVNARGLYTKRDGSPVSAFQIHGRTRNYPHLFTQAGSTIGLARWGNSPSGLEVALLDTSKFWPAGTIDLEVPGRPGFYAIRVRDRGALPAPFNVISESRDTDLLYVGIAATSLKRRFLGQELRGRGHGTVFRSIGAMLGYRPPTGSLIGKRNTRNFKFTPSDSQEIIGWIDSNLIVNWIEFSGAHAAVESQLIKTNLPLLNIKGNPAHLEELSALRAECVRIANTESA